MRDRKTGRIIWYLFSAVLVKWGVEIAVATFALSCGLHSNMGIGAISSIITIPMIVVYFMAQKYFIEGITFSGLKG